MLGVQRLKLKVIAVYGAGHRTQQQQCGMNAAVRWAASGALRCG
jgi:hypothetical protein